MDETMFPGQRPAIGVRAIVDGRDSLRPAHTGPARALARQVCELLRRTVRYGDGEPVRCVLADEAVGSAQDALRAQEQFRAQNVGAVISVARAWSYPFEVMCLDDRLPQLVWGFSGSDAPGTVFMAAATSTAAQHGLPFFKVYGRDIRPAADTHIPPDVAQQLVQFAQCALAVATMRGRTYLRLGNTCMGIGASMPDEHFFRAYLGMRVQSMDMTGLLHRMQAGIYDRQEFETARAWVREHCREMEDPNPPQLRLSPAEKERVWDDSVRMALIFRDLMDGNPRLADAFGPEAAAGHAALTASFQGQRQWTDFLPTADFAESILNAGFDWNGPRRPHPVATENDALQAAAMLFGTLLTGAAQLFCDVRGYWSPAAMEERLGRRGADVPDGFLYLTNSGSMALDGSMEALRGGSPAIKPFWELTAQDAARCAAATRWGPAKRGGVPGGRLLRLLPRPGRRAADHGAAEPGEGPGPGAADRRGAHGGPGAGPGAGRRPPDRPHLAPGVLRAPAHRPLCQFQRLPGDRELGQQPLRALPRPCGRAAGDPGLHAAHPRELPQPRARAADAPGRVEAVRRGRPHRRRLPRLRRLRAPVRPLLSKKTPRPRTVRGRGVFSCGALAAQALWRITVL